MTTFFAIFHTPSRKTMPSKPARYHAGATWVEPTFDEPPRLFKTARDAQVSLTWWLRGQASKAWSLDQYGEERPETTTEAVPSRQAAEFQVVLVFLTYSGIKP